MPSIFPFQSWCQIYTNKKKIISSSFNSTQSCGLKPIVILGMVARYNFHLTQSPGLKLIVILELVAYQTCLDVHVALEIVLQMKSVLINQFVSWTLEKWIICHQNQTSKYYYSISYYTMSNFVHRLSTELFSWIINQLRKKIDIHIHVI